MATTFSTARSSQLTRAMKWSVLQRHRSRLHLGRKFYHCLCGLLCFSLYAFAFDRVTALTLLGSVGGFLVLYDVARLKSPALNEIALRLFGPLMRREELMSLSGNSFYILGIFLVTLVFPKPVALLAVLYLALGDPAAAIVGSAVGKRQIWRGKTLEGALANFAVCFLATLIFSAFFFSQPVWLIFSFAII